MTKPHKWHKEIKAWADGLTIQYKDENFPDWIDTLDPDWNTKSYIEFRIKPQKTEPLIISEEPVAVVYSMQDGYVGQMIKKGLPHKTLLYAHQDKPQPKEPQFEEYITPYADVNIIFKPQPKEQQYLYVYYRGNGEYKFESVNAHWNGLLPIGKIKLEDTENE